MNKPQHTPPGRGPFPPIGATKFFRYSATAVLERFGTEIVVHGERKTVRDAVGCQAEAVDDAPPEKKLNEEKNVTFRRTGQTKETDQ